MGAARARLSRAGLLAAALALALCAAVAVRSAWLARASCHPAKKPLRAEERAAARAALPGLEEVSFATRDGLALRGWWVPSRQGAAVVLVHGGYDNRAHWLPELRLLAARGYGVLAYDSRGSGESGGELVTAGDREQADVAAALDFVCARPGVDRARIGLVGFSFGSSAAALQAARDPRVRALALESTWTSFEDETRAKRGRWGPLSSLPALWALRREGIDLANLRPVDHLAELSPRPLLLIAGADDDDTPVPVMQRLFAAAREPKELWVVPHARHGDVAAAAPAEYERRLLAFFDGALQQVEPPEARAGGAKAP